MTAATPQATVRAVKAAGSGLSWPQVAGRLGISASTLRHRFRAHFGLSMRDREAFMASTGVTATPRVLLLSADDRVRYVGKNIDPAVIDEIFAMLGSEDGMNR